MRKTISMAIIAMFLVSIIPFVFAERLLDSKLGIRAESRDGNDSAKVEARDEIKLRNNEARAELKEEYRGKLNILRENYRAKIEALGEEKAKMFANLSSDRLQKIAKLDKKQIERLAKLNVKNLYKIAELKADRLERLTELEENKLERISELNQSDIEKISDLNRARIKELAKMNNAELKEELKAIHFVKVKNADELNQRNLTQANLTQLRERFENAKQEFKDAKEELEVTRKALKEARDKGDEKGSIEHAKDYLSKVADALILHLEKIKAKVQENKNIGNETEAKIVADIDTQISEINQIKAHVQAATTKEQVKEAAKELKKKWNSLKHLIDLYSKRVVAARVEGIVHRGLVLEKQLDHVLEKAKEKGIEVNATAEISNFSQEIANSKEKYLAAQAKISEAFDLRAKNESANSEKIKSLLDEVNQLLKESRDSLKQAHETLKAIVKIIKTAMPEADLSAEAEIEVESD